MEPRTLQRESFPKFDLVAAKTAMDRNVAAVCVFECRGKVVGQAFITDVHDDCVILNSLVLQPYDTSEERQDIIRTVEVSSKMARTVDTLFVLDVMRRSSRYTTRAIGYAPIVITSFIEANSSVRRSSYGKNGTSSVNASSLAGPRACTIGPT
jgi:hypothetical protein